MTGEAIPIGSKRELIVERIPLFVNGLEGRFGMSKKLSFFVFHCTPRAAVLPPSEGRVVMAVALTAPGKASNTSCELLMTLCNFIL